MYGWIGLRGKACVAFATVAAAEAELSAVQFSIARTAAALDGCWCDDGRDLQECPKCVANSGKYERLRTREAELRIICGDGVPA